MLPGYADVHIKYAVVEGLRRGGMDVVTAQERGQSQADDEVLLATATSEQRLVLTNDTDFLRIHSDWLVAQKSHAGIVYWPQDKYSIGVTIRRILAYSGNTLPPYAANWLQYL